MNQTKISLHANVKSRCCEPPSSYRHTEHSKTTAYDTALCCKARRESIRLKKKQKRGAAC